MRNIDRVIEGVNHLARARKRIETRGGVELRFRCQQIQGSGSETHYFSKKVAANSTITPCPDAKCTRQGIMAFRDPMPHFPETTYVARPVVKPGQ